MFFIHLSCYFSNRYKCCCNGKTMIWDKKRMSLFTSSLDTVPTSKLPKNESKDRWKFCCFSWESRNICTCGGRRFQKTALSPRILREGSKAQDFLDTVFSNDSLLFTPRRDQMTRILSGFDAQHKATDSATATPPVSHSWGRIRSSWGGSW